MYEAVMSWIKSNVDDNSQYLPMLVSQLRLAQLPSVCLRGMVSSEELIRQDTACRDCVDEAKDYKMSLVQPMSQTALHVAPSDRVLPRRSYAG